MSFHDTILGAGVELCVNGFDDFSYSGHYEIPNQKPSKADPMALFVPSVRKKPIDGKVTGLSLAAAHYAPWNFVVVVAYQVILRVGWIFKTESIVMPAVLSAIGGSPMLLGCLPLLNRLGHSVPPLLMSRRIKVSERKKWPLACYTLGMSVSFLAMASMWVFTGGETASWMPYVFVLLYALFFVATGVTNLTIGVMQGKLIASRSRGRLLLCATVVGVVLAISCAWLLMPRWIDDSTTDFRFVFGFAGSCFLVGAFVCLLLVEPRDRFVEAAQPIRRVFRDAFRTLAYDKQFRLLGIIAALFGSSMTLFPHYQSLAREEMDLGLKTIIGWVIVQNIGSALFSLVAGPLADKRGNRIVLRFVLVGIFAAPIIAILLSASSLPGKWFAGVFFIVGITPITFRTLQNFTLELAPRADHARYLSALSLCFAAPIFFSPLCGKLVGLFSHEPVFIAVSFLVFTGWLLTFLIGEPRHLEKVA